MKKKVLYVLGGIAAVLFLMPQVSTAADSLKNVFVTNDTAHPVPTLAQGTTQVGGSVSVDGSVDVNGSVDVGTGPEAREPYQKTLVFNQDPSVGTQFVCTASFPAVPAGKRLLVTYASARYALTSGGTAPSVELTDGTSVFTGDSQFEDPTGSISAAAVVITIPIILFVLFFQRRIVSGLTSGAVKG